TADRNRSHWSTSKTPSYTKSVSWQHHPLWLDNRITTCALLMPDAA
ncbi:transposase, partial [Shigella sonnei]|nr:transposase [Shigella sonnei]